VKRLYDVWGKDIDAVCMCVPPIVIILMSMAKVVTSIRFESEVLIISFYMFRFVRSLDRSAGCEQSRRINASFSIKAACLFMKYRFR